MIKEIEATELAQLKEQGDAVRVIDIRNPAELLRGIIPGSEALPMHTIPLRMSELSRDVKTVMVCHSGARSAQACMYLMQQGYENVFNLRGGMMAWHGNGHEIGLPQTG
ncbi:MAG: rhodanese-like domain-containing protein [Gammaproteobacteria bacterium]|nr:rhodanese-like domain-containing protein [Gammaproteobacteria bacterium]MCW8986832.1 rhodanese-like domain-containing protein [Gammaproteobacteria bacterium]MCW9032081.1 rhodanese-like domain-containing protein [Gammaproteobacteria bacterium]